MAYCHDDDCFICAQGRKLRLRREMTEQQNGQFVTTAWYRCENCAGCPCRAQCCRAKDPNQPKEVVMQRTFWEKREQAARNISSGARHSSASVPLYSGGRGVCAAEKRFWISALSHQRQRQYSHGTVFPCPGV